MTDLLMTTRELAEYLSLNEKKIYALVKKGGIPYTRVTGKYLFPRGSIDRWIEDSVVGASAGEGSGKVTFTGSHDPAVDLLVSETGRSFPEVSILTANVGSKKGVEILQSGGTDMAGIHILDEETSDYNLPWLKKHISGSRPVLVHFAMRSQGLIVAAGNPLGMTGPGDLVDGRARFVRRQEGSGTRLLFDHLIRTAGLDMKGIDLSPGEAATHNEVAQAVRSGRADAGMGVKSAAVAAGLDFIHLADESFDIAVSRTTFYSEPVQKILEVVRSSEFRVRVEGMGGYDMKDSGSVISWG